MVIFDIDSTILNVSQRYKDARRANYIDKDGAPKKKSTFETLGKARKRAHEFLFSPDNLRKDTAIPGAIGLVNDLVAQGHIIAYVTARNFNFRDVTRNQLEDKGFPLFKDDSDMELLFLKDKLGESTSQYKEGVYAKLLASYDVRMVFDDMKENLQAAVSQGITGVYPSIQDYTRYQVKSNPHAFYSSIVDDKGYPKEDPDEEPYQSYRSHADESGMGRTGYSAKNPPLNCGCGKSPCMTFGGLKNPGDIQSRVESILIKEGGAAGLKPLKAAFPEGTTKKQATAAIAKMDTIRLHKHGDYILKNPLNIRDDANPDYYLCQSCGHEADPVEYAEIRSDPSLNIGGTSPICPYCGNQNAYEPRYHWQDEGHTMAPLSFKNPEEYSEDYMVPRDIHRLGKAADSLESTYDEQDVPEWWKSKLSVAAKDADTLADSLSYVNFLP